MWPRLVAHAVHCVQVYRRTHAGRTRANTLVHSTAQLGNQRLTPCRKGWYISLHSPEDDLVPEVGYLPCPQSLPDARECLPDDVQDPDV